MKLSDAKCFLYQWKLLARLLHPPPPQNPRSFPCEITLVIPSRHINHFLPTFAQGFRKKKRWMDFRIAFRHLHLYISGLFYAPFSSLTISSRLSLSLPLSLSHLPTLIFFLPLRVSASPYPDEKFAFCAAHFRFDPFFCKGTDLLESVGLHSGRQFKWRWNQNPTSPVRYLLGAVLQVRTKSELRPISSATKQKQSHAKQNRYTSSKQPPVSSPENWTDAMRGQVSWNLLAKSAV